MSYENRNDSRENFCGACLAVPLAMVGVGVGAAGATTKGSHQRTKKVLLWSGVATVIISLLIAIYFLYIKKCSSCR
jgi:hypothetical protein